MIFLSNLLKPSKFGATIDTMILVSCRRGICENSDGARRTMACAGMGPKLAGHLPNLKDLFSTAKDAALLTAVVGGRHD